MIPYSYSMVDMGAIDLAEANCTVVEGIYNRIIEAVNACGDAIFYNWKFAGIEIAPSAVNTLEVSDSILINGIIQVTELDEVTVLGIEPPPPPIEPVSPLEVTENGVYEAEPPASGFNPVTVAVPERQPVIESISITENGAYSAPEGVDGFSPVTVSVEVGAAGPFPISEHAGDFTTGWYQTRTVRRVLQEGKLVMARWRWNNGTYACGAFYSLRDYPLGDVVVGDYLAKSTIDISSVGIGYSTLYVYGGMNGAGADASILFNIDGALLYLAVPVEVGENIPTGPTSDPNFGIAFNAMSNSLKEEFWNSVLQTI